jgi:hypothetical protein
VVTYPFSAGSADTAVDRERFDTEYCQADIV